MISVLCTCPWGARCLGEKRGLVRYQGMLVSLAHEESLRHALSEGKES